jgi:hypothetical protein
VFVGLGDDDADLVGATGVVGGGGGTGVELLVCFCFGVLLGFGGFGATDGVGWWLVSGGVPVTLAGGGNSSTGTPSMSAFITAVQVRAG